FAAFARKDRIGKVMAETVDLLSRLCEDSVSAANLIYEADSVCTTRANTMKHDGTQAPMNLEELLHAYNEMRKCCY
ncbi:hypothetical protein PFISCL1PPCAC_7236, partial [Pristionchus fissidentatus]